MKLNFFKKQLSIVGRWVAVALFCLSTIAIGQGAFFANAPAIAAPSLIAASDVGDQVQGKARQDAGRAKNFIRDTADRVEQTAKKNANRVEEATDGNGSFVERKAKRDASRIEQRAERDSARTQKAVDDTKNIVERTVDNVKDAFSN
jgi:uncharacterized protein YjbJ (UPF0337 family)